MSSPILTSLFSHQRQSPPLPTSSDVDSSPLLQLTISSPHQNCNNQDYNQIPSPSLEDIKTLNQLISIEKPLDVLHFCNDYFSKQIRSCQPVAPRSPLLACASLLRTTAMSNFPGGHTNPFGGPSSSGMQRVKEDEEMDTLVSPQGASFQPGGFGRASGSSPFGGSFNPQPVGDADLPANYTLGRRTSVSAESMNPAASASDNWSPPSHSKTQDQISRISAAVAANFLFSHLDDEQKYLVLDALFEKPIPAKGIKVISQGDAGDNFYVVEKGNFDVYIHPSGSIQAGSDGLGKKVASIGPGGSFGELALMYNAPRAATIISTEAGSLLWALDRLTFRRILMDAAFQRRRMYESFLEEVTLLSSLTAYERSKIADALETQKFAAGDVIIKEGDIGEAFFLLESGTAAVTKAENGDKVLLQYSKGDYFGELALLDDKPRAASVHALTDVKVASLGKDGFRRLLGPVEERMREQDPSKRQAGAQTGARAAAHAPHASLGGDGVDPLQS